NEHQQSQDFISEIFALNNLLCYCECVTELFFRVLGFFNGFSNLVKSPRLQSNADSLVKLLISKTSVEHSVDDTFHLEINLNLFFLVIYQYSLLNVFVNTLVDQSVHILRSFVQIES